MRALSLAVLAFVALLGACGNREMERQAQAIVDEWGKPTADLSLSMQYGKRDGQDKFHCVLTNESDHPITVDESLLPWLAPGLIDARAVTDEGKLLPPDPIIKQITNSPRPITIAAGQSLEVEFEIAYLPIRLPREHDTLVVWRYGLADEHSHRHKLVGTTYLPSK